MEKSDHDHVHDNDHDQHREGAANETPIPWSPYRAERTLRSAGRTPLTSAFSLYMAARSGISPIEIADAFEPGGDANDRAMIEREIDHLASIFVDGRLRTFARRFGGGDPVELPASAWEIDDAVGRFATGAVNADAPHDDAASATHWIFVDNAQWDAAMDGLRDLQARMSGDWESEDPVDLADTSIVVTAVRSNEPSTGPIGGRPLGEPNAQWRDEVLGLERVMAMTGLSRSTIYAKIAAGTFPRQIQVHGSRVGWRRGKVQDWLEALTPANPAAQVRGLR